VPPRHFGQSPQVHAVVASAIGRVDRVTCRAPPDQETRKHIQKPSFRAERSAVAESTSAVAPHGTLSGGCQPAESPAVRGVNSYETVATEWHGIDTEKHPIAVIPREAKRSRGIHPAYAKQSRGHSARMNAEFNNRNIRETPCHLRLNVPRQWMRDLRAERDSLTTPRTSVVDPRRVDTRRSERQRDPARTRVADTCTRRHLLASPSSHGDTCSRMRSANTDSVQSTC
jgi:hypothetical protein